MILDKFSCNLANSSGYVKWWMFYRTAHQRFKWEFGDFSLL